MAKIERIVHASEPLILRPLSFGVLKRGHVGITIFPGPEAAVLGGPAVLVLKPGDKVRLMTTLFFSLDSDQQEQVLAMLGAASAGSKRTNKARRRK